MGKTTSKLRKLGAFAAALMFVLMASTLMVSADAAAKFSVKAEIPENQISENSYFDLRMQPGQKQDIRVLLTNSSSDEVIVLVEANSASTSMYGDINYKQAGIRDQSLTTAFTEIATVNEPEVILPPGQSKYTTITLNMPVEQYDGKILGGLIFTQSSRTEDEPENQTGGMAISNRYSYVVGVVLSETDTKVPVELEGVRAFAEIQYSRPAIVSEIRNPTSNIIKNANLTVQIKKDGSSETLWESSKENAEFAPNSLMPYTLFQTDEAVKPGKYISFVHIEHSEGVWDFELPFEIKADEALRLNEENALSPTAMNEGSIPNWAFILIIVLFIFLIILLLLMIVILNRSKKKQ